MELGEGGGGGDSGASNAHATSRSLHAFPFGASGARGGSSPTAQTSRRPHGHRRPLPARASSLLLWRRQRRGQKARRTPAGGRSFVGAAPGDSSFAHRPIHAYETPTSPAPARVSTRVQLRLTCRGVHGHASVVFGGGGRNLVSLLRDKSCTTS